MARLQTTVTIDDPMTRQFRVFYEQVLRARERAGEALETEPDAVVRTVKRQLEDLLELQTLESRRESSRFELDNVADARYLKAALADEILLHTPWIGRDRWTTHLLEAALFRTNIAGDLVFRRIEQLLAEREPSRRDLARLYLFALALGFQGHYRGSAETARLEALREELYHFIHQRPADLTGRERVLCERAYAHTLSHPVPRQAPAMTRWSLFCLIGLIVLLACSELLWLWQSWPVRRVLQPAIATVAPQVATTSVRGGPAC